MRYELTADHRYRGRALAVPGSYWDREHGHYAIIDPTKRAARAAIALFPDILNRHPDLIEVSNAGLESVRPTDHATPYATPLEGDLGGVSLYPWQQTDLGFVRRVLERDGAAALLWDRGLGKTLAAAALMQSFRCERTLVVCRNDAKVPVWRNQLRDLLPDHELLVLPNPKAKRERMLAWVGDDARRPRVFIVHYEALALIAGDKGKGSGWDKLGTWDLMVFDEGHRLASMNPNGARNTQLGRATMKARKRSSMALNLTGSSIMNRAEDLFGQLHYLFPKTYKAKWRDYNDRFLDYVSVDGRPFCIGFKDETLPALRDELGVFSVYRTKAEELDLPPVVQQDIMLELGPAQRKAYEQMRDEFWARLDDGSALISSNVLAQLNNLRQMATWVEGLDSAKLDFAMSEIEEEPDAQFVVFTWYKAPGRSLAARLNARFGDGTAVAVDGDVKKEERTANLESHRLGRSRVLVGSIATLGESLNLQYCHEAIRLDRHWNPGVNAQTRDRLIRDGQKFSVTFRDLIAVDTVDQLRVQPTLTSKDSLRKAVFGS